MLFGKTEFKLKTNFLESLSQINNFRWYIIIW